MISVRNDLTFIESDDDPRTAAGLAAIDREASYSSPQYAVYCRLCRRWIARGFTRHLTSEHNTNVIQYAERFPGSRTKPDLQRRVHVMSQSKRYGSYIVPTGLLDLVTVKLPHIAVNDRRRRPADRRSFEWTGPEPRAYQVEAIQAALRPNPPRGLIESPIRSGKTLIAARIIRRLGWKTVFVVETDILLRQTTRALSGYLGGEEIGVAGGGKWAPRWITVATVQTLLKREAVAKELLDGTDLLIVDEIHHMKADRWREPIVSCDAWGKIGLSATIFSTDGTGVWLRAACGPKLCEVSVSRLVGEGYLMAPLVLIYDPTPMSAVGVARSTAYSTAYRDAIVRSTVRNAMIADLAEDGARRGMCTLIDTGRVEQLKILKTMLETRGVNVETIYGQTPSPVRDRLLEKFSRGEIQVLIGTVLGEGVDIPELEMVINAEGLASKISTIQRLRNLTIHTGKSRVIVVDFSDQYNRHLKRHADGRIAVYRDHLGFDVRAVWGASGGAKLPVDLIGDVPVEEGVET